MAYGNNHEVKYDIPKYEELRNKHLSHMNISDIADVAHVTGATNDHIMEVLDFTDLNDDLSEGLIPNDEMLQSVTDYMGDILDDDPECEGMCMAGDTLVDICEKFLFTKVFYDTPRSEENIHKFIRNRTSALLGKLTPEVERLKALPAYQNVETKIDQESIVRSVIKLHAAKVMIVDGDIEEHIGVPIKEMDDSLFVNKEEAITGLVYYNIHQLQNLLGFRSQFRSEHTLIHTFLTELPSKGKHPNDTNLTLKEITEHIQNIIREAKNVYAKEQKDTDDAFRSYRKLKGYDTDKKKDPTTDNKYQNLKKKAEDAEQKHKNFMRQTRSVMEPEITSSNFSATIPPLVYGTKSAKAVTAVAEVLYVPPVPASPGPPATPAIPAVNYVAPVTGRGNSIGNPVNGTSRPIINPLYEDEVKEAIAPLIQEYHQEVADEYFTDIFGAVMDEDSITQKKEDEYYPALEEDAQNPSVRSKFIQSEQEAEDILTHEKQLNVSLRAGAWFKMTNADEKNPDGAISIYKVAANRNGMVYFEGHDRPMSQKELVQYLMNPNYGAIKKTNITVEFLYDGHKEPIRSLHTLEEKLGLRTTEDKTPGAKIIPGMHITSYDKDNKKNVLRGKIQGITGSEIILADEQGNPGVKTSFEKFFAMLTAHGLQVETGSNDFDQLESLTPMHGKKTAHASLASIYSNLKYKVSNYAKSWKKKFDIWEMEDMVNGAKIGSDDWKEKNTKLMGKEKEEVDAKVKELGEAYPKGGPKRKALAAFMLNPPDIRTFPGRVLAKAWLQLTLTTFGTIYPSGNLLGGFEKKRFWLRLFSVSTVPNDPKTFRSPIDEAIDNASKVVGVTDSRVEFTALLTLIETGKYTHPCLAGSMGKGFKGEITGWETTGKEATIKAKTDTISKATLPEIYKIVSETIENQEWPSLLATFEKLAAKGYGAAEMFNLFFYAMDQAHYMEGSQHRSKMPLKDLALIGKAIFPKFPLPIFAVMGSEENMTNFYRMMYSNAHVKNNLKWKSGEWDKKVVGDYSFATPKDDTAKNLYKFFNAREGDYTMLRGISEDFKKSEKKPYSYKKEDEDYVNFRAMYDTVFSNYTGLKAGPEIDKKNWNHMPLLTLNGKYFAALHGGQESLKNGHWDSDEAQMYVESLMKEYTSAMRSNLPEADKDELQRRVGKFIWDTFYDKFKYNESINAAANQSHTLVPDDNRRFFTKNYSKELTKLGFSHYRLNAKFGGGDKDFIYPTGSPNHPIIPNGQNNNQGNNYGVQKLSNYELYSRQQSDNAAKLNAAPTLRT